MAVPQNRKSRSRSRMRRGQMRAAAPELCVESGSELPDRDRKGTGSMRRRHHMGKDGIYRGFKFYYEREKIVRPPKEEEEEVMEPLYLDPTNPPTEGGGSR